MEIEYLADHMHFAPLLACWHHREWSSRLPGWSEQDALAELQSHTGHCQVPTTLVALEGANPVGSASLVVSDLDGWEHLSPWLASVFVVPEFRGRGVGRQLVRRILQEAQSLEISTVYLFTFEQEKYYERLGWEHVERTTCHGREVVVMRCAP